MIVTGKTPYLAVIPARAGSKRVPCKNAVLSPDGRFSLGRSNTPAESRMHPCGPW